MSGVILFDGTCAFCEGSVKFIAERDNGYHRFGASQTPEGRALLEQHGIDREAARSIVLIEDGMVYLRSTAVLRIARHMRAPWNASAMFLLVPRPIRDFCYGIVASIRHRIAGESNACEIPPPEIRARLI